VIEVGLDFATPSELFGLIAVANIAVCAMLIFLQII
jgi:hypothetical protein